MHSASHARALMADYAELRQGAQSLPELSAAGGYDRFRTTNASARGAFDDAMSAAMADLKFDGAAKKAEQAPRNGRRAKAKAKAKAKAQRTKPPPRKHYVKEEGMANTYDRERTPGGNPQPKLKGWASWELTQVKDIGGVPAVVCAATSFDPPWRATEDREGATIAKHPGYHHSAVGPMSAEEMRKERAQRRLAIAAGERLEPALELATAPKGPAAKRREFMKMDFTCQLLEKAPAYLHSAVGNITPEQMRKEREAMPSWEVRHSVGISDAQQAADPTSRAQMYTTQTHWRKPNRRGNQLAASQRMNHFQFENKPDFTFMPHPGPISVEQPVAKLSPDELRAERAHRKVLGEEADAQRAQFLAAGGAKNMVDLSRSGRIRRRQEAGWRNPSPNPEPVYVEKMTV